jgi:hypothetical protein
MLHENFFGIMDDESERERNNQEQVHISVTPESWKNVTGNCVNFSQNSVIVKYNNVVWHYVRINLYIVSMLNYLFLFLAIVLETAGTTLL